MDTALAPSKLEAARSAESGRTTIPIVIALPIALILILAFIAVLFPWDSVGRRIAHEIAAGSGSQITIQDLRPALTARGPVLAAHDLDIQHPAVERVRVATLEIAPRWSTSWFGAEPTLRFWADSELGLIDGVLRLGESSTFVGRISGVEIEKLPLRLESSGFDVFGIVAADADLALDPRGILTGRIDFESPELFIESNLLPLPIPFSRAEGVIEMLPTGATRIESIAFEGDFITGQLSGEISMAHRSESPPIDLTTEIQIIQPELRDLAPGAGIPISGDGRANLRLGGTIDEPEITPIDGARD